MSKLRLFLLTGFLAAAIAPLSGCGSECGPGTIAQDGQCVVVAGGCGEGTILSEKRCVVDTSGCGAGTRFDGEVCVPDQSSCENGTTFDELLGVCVADAEIVCGENTVANDDNVCVPSAEICGETTQLDDEGRCVIQAAACGAGTELDPTTGNCVLADEACAAGLALDTDSGECVPTEDVCSRGTVYDGDSGLCLPDACKEGDVLINGVCMDPLEEAAYNADLTETENNDPNVGGTANTLTVHPIGGEAFTFSGTISEPSDLNTDGRLDQDVDVFEFDAAAGDWIQIGVQSVGLPSPAFEVEGPNGYLRQSEITLAGQTARQLVAPADGTYTVTVLPSLTLQSPQVGPSGAEGWGYLGTIRTVAAPTPAAADVSAGPAQLSGAFTDLSDNLFSLNGATAADVLTFTVDDVGAHAEGVLVVFSDATTVYHAEPIASGDTIIVGMPASGDATVLIDWTKSVGANNDFDLSVEVTGEQQHINIPAGGTESLTLTLSQFDQLVASQNNSAGADLELAISDESGTELASALLAPGEPLAQVVFADGDYTIEVTNNSQSAVDTVISSSVTPPVDLGQLGNDAALTSPASSLAAGAKAYYVASANAGQVVSFSHDNAQSEDISYAVYDATGTQLLAGSALDARSNAAGFDYEDVIWTFLDSDVTYLIEVSASAAVTGQVLELQSQTPQNLGPLDAQSTVSLNPNSGLQADESDFYLVDFTQTMDFSAVGESSNGESFSFFLYDSSSSEVTSTTATSSVRVVETLPAPGLHLVRIAADEQLSGYDFDLGGLTTEHDMGTLTSGVTYTSPTLGVFDSGQELAIRFSVPAGHVIEISQDNAESEDHEGFLFDAQGTEVASAYYFYASSSSDAEYIYHYAENGGDFEFIFEGWSTSTNAAVSIRIFAPDNLGQIAPGGTLNHTVNQPAELNQRYYHLIEFTDSANITGLLSPANSESLDFRLEALDGTSVISKTGSGGDVNISGAVDDAGYYLVRVDANEAATGYSLTLNTEVNSADFGALSSGSTASLPPLANFGSEQSYTLNFNVPAGHVIEVSQDNNEGVSQSVELRDASDLLDDESSMGARSSTSADYLYWYTEDGGDFSVLLEGENVATGQSVRVSVLAPEDLGQLDSVTTINTTVTQSLSEGQSYFRRVEITEPIRFDVTLAPAGGEDLDFELLATDNSSVLSESGSGGNVTISGKTVAWAGTYVVRVDADEDATGFTLTFDNTSAMSEDLGTLLVDSSQTSTPLSVFNSGEQFTYTFTVPAGQAIEISHDNVEAEDHAVTLYGPNQQELESSSYFYPASYSSPDYTYGYSDSGGTYTLVMKAGADVTGQTLTVRTFSPVDLGSLGLDSSTSHNRTVGLGAGQADMYLVTFNQRSAISIETVVPGGEDTDLYVYDLQMNQVVSETSGSPAYLQRMTVPAGTYLVKILAYEATPSFQLDVATAPEPISNSPELAIPDGSNGAGTTVTDTIGVSGSCAVLDAVEVYLDLSHTSRGDLTVDLVSPSGTRVTLHDQSGGPAEDIVGWYPATLTVDGPGALADFVGEAADGEWTIEVTDSYGGDTGTLHQWAMLHSCQ